MKQKSHINLDFMSMEYFAVLNLKFSFDKSGCLNKAKEPRLPYYIPIAGRQKYSFLCQEY